MCLKDLSARDEDYFMPSCNGSVDCEARILRVGASLGRNKWALKSLCSDVSRSNKQAEEGKQTSLLHTSVFWKFSIL